MMALHSSCNGTMPCTHRGTKEMMQPCPDPPLHLISLAPRRSPLPVPAVGHQIRVAFRPAVVMPVRPQRDERLSGTKEMRCKVDQTGLHHLFGAAVVVPLVQAAVVTRVVPEEDRKAKAVSQLRRQWKHEAKAVSQP